MKRELPILNSDGTVVASRQRLLHRLHAEAKQRKLRVNLCRGPEEYGSEAFYTLSDGTKLHEVNGTAKDGSDYRAITLVVGEAKVGLLQRWLSRGSERWSPAARH